MIDGVFKKKMMTASVKLCSILFNWNKFCVCVNRAVSNWDSTLIHDNEKEQAFALAHFLFLSPSQVVVQISWIENIIIRCIWSASRATPPKPHTVFQIVWNWPKQHISSVEHFSISCLWPKPNRTLEFKNLKVCSAHIGAHCLWSKHKCLPLLCTVPLHQTLSCIPFIPWWWVGWYLAERTIPLCVHLKLWSDSLLPPKSQVSGAVESSSET